MKNGIQTLINSLIKKINLLNHSKKKINKD